VVLGLVLLTYGLLLVLGATRSAQLNQAQKKTTQIETELKSNQDLAATLKQYNGLVGVSDHIDNLLTNRFLFLPSWNLVKSLVPKEVQFTSITVQDDRTYRIAGESRSVSGVANLAKALQSNSAFTNVVPLSVNRNAAKNTYTFSITFKISPKIATGATQ
jgi:Tfp pilus assembly protein PilN